MTKYTYLLLLVIPFSGCSRSNQLLLGKVQATVGTHPVIVTDCYRTEVPAPEKLLDAGQETWRFTPCRDADVLIKGELLSVNGQPYGKLHPRDAVLVDHGVVSVQRN